MREVFDMKDNLQKYNEKRDFLKTKEPSGKKKKPSKKLKFVVQHHFARREHYDLRLEWNGVMKSWAVPKGPSYNTKDKRLAVLVEDHPLDYRHFEGTIPKGEYGGGTVMIWDKGYYEPLGDFESEFQEGALKFELFGERLQGKWTLVHFKEDNWLLIKERDEVKGYKDITKFKTSVKTGRTMEEIENKIKPQKSARKASALHKVEITNPDKIIYQKPKITKLDVIKYYDKVAPRMLPFLEKRLISTIRCPEGIKGSCFFKKHLETKSDGLKKVNIKNDSGNKEDYYYITNAEGILSEIQMNSFEFHLWGCQVGSINRPDMMVFDLDPDEGMNLKQVRQGVKDLKSILDEFSLVSFLKTSGGKGYHVVVPIHSLKTWKNFRETARNIAKLMEVRWPDKYVSNMRKERRKNKIFIDWVRNTKGSTSIAPYSLRVRDGAPVSMPIKWSELDKIAPNEITLEKALQRLKRKDPWDGFFEIEQ